MKKLLNRVIEKLFGKYIPKLASTGMLPGPEEAFLGEGRIKNEKI